MKTLRLAILLFVASTIAASAQLKTPQASSGQTIIQDLGVGKITLTYSRPGLRGRKIFGGMEPYGKVWRAGANWATTIQFTNDVTIEGKAVPAGTYALFAIPQDGSTPWTFILNKNAKQWGAYTYKESDDVIRVSVKPLKTKEKVETLTMQFTNVMQGSCELHITWENVDLPVHLATDYDSIVMADIEKAMAGERKPYFQAAQYYYYNDKDMAKALEWMNAVEKASPKDAHAKYWKARIQLKGGDKAGAKVTAQAGMDLAKAANDAEYVRLNSEVLAEVSK